jgi:hypothetical protein
MLCHSLGQLGFLWLFYRPLLPTSRGGAVLAVDMTDTFGRMNHISSRLAFLDLTSNDVRLSVEPASMRRSDRCAKLVWALTELTS